jgi:hypothetical protein
MNENQLKYSLPLLLLRALEEEQVHSNLDANDWLREKHFSKECEEAGCVGEWNGQAIRYALLRPPPTVNVLFDAIPQEWRKDLAWERSGWAEIAKQRDYVSEKIDKQAREVWLQRAAYAGWLVTNKEFIDEHDAFFARHAAPLRTYGLPILDGTSAATSALRAREPARGKVAKFVTAYTQFLSRWGLSRMAAPYLAEPFAPEQTLRPGEPAPPSIKRRAGSTKVLDLNYLKLLSPQQREKWLRLHTDSPDHLRGWSKIVDTASSRRVQLERYARLLQLRHYWFVINQCFGIHLAGKKHKMTSAFARFLFPKAARDQKFETTKKDLQWIRQSLCDREWATKGPMHTSGV